MERANVYRRFAKEADADLIAATVLDGEANAGCYRLMYRTPRQTSIDLVSPTDLRTFYQRAMARNEPLPIRAMPRTLFSH